MEIAEKIAQQPLKPEPFSATDHERITTAIEDILRQCERIQTKRLARPQRKAS
jgi:hypothetical protein